MNRIAKFEKVSFERFKEDWEDCAGYASDDDYIKRLFINDDYIKRIYDNITLPIRATTGSAGYDFFMPDSINLCKHEVIKIPTGIRCKIDEGWVLKLYPRSGMGFKTGVHMANTVGVIDSDYYHSDNEGHIFIKLVNDSILSKEIEINSGDAFCQGVFVPFGITIDDDTTGVRNGGFGSTEGFRQHD